MRHINAYHNISYNQCYFGSCRFLGTILPFIPGVPIAWLGLFIFAIGTGFKRISLITAIVFFVIMLLTFAVDFFAPMLGAKKTRQAYGELSELQLGLS